MEAWTLNNSDTKQLENFESFCYMPLLKVCRVVGTMKYSNACIKTPEKKVVGVFWSSDGGIKI